MGQKVLLPEKVAEEGIELLKELGYEVKIGRGLDKEILIEDLADCDAVVIRVAVIDEEVMKSCPKLKVIAKHGAGYDSIDISAAEKLGIRVVFAPLANSLSVAEHAMALILALAKKLPYMESEYQDDNYAIKNSVLLSEVSGKTLGLIGMGRIASHLSSMAYRGFGMRVVAYDPYIPSDQVIEGVTLVDDRDELLRMSDYVSIHIPSTKETKKSIGAREFKLMKNSARLINVARGSILDERELIAALEKGEIAGAGLDVTDPEPASMDNPMFSMDQVILTPHCAASTEEAMVRMVYDSVYGIHDVLTGRDPEYLVV